MGPLTQVLQDPSFGVRNQAACALGDLDDVRAVVDLVHLAMDASYRSEIRRRACQNEALNALIKIGCSEKASLRIVTDSRLSAAEKLSTLEALAQFGRTYRYVLETKGNPIQDSDIALYCRSLLGHSDPAVRASVEDILRVHADRSKSLHLLRASQSTPDAHPHYLLRSAVSTNTDPGELLRSPSVTKATETVLKPDGKI